MPKGKSTRPPADAAALREGLETAVRQALDESSLDHCVGESGTITLGVQLRLDQGRVFYVDAGVGFQRRLF